MQGIIFSADIDTIEDVQFFTDICADYDELKGIKIGVTLALRYGLRNVVKKVREIKNLQIIYDHQKAGTDIPAMGKEFAKICRDAEVDAIIIFPHAGPKTLEAFIVAAIEHRIEPIVGLVMTHPEFLLSEGGFIVDDAPNRILRIADKKGVKSFILPGTKLEIVKKYCSELSNKTEPVNIYMPGIGTQGGNLTSAFQAVGNNNPYAIVGSLIYNSKNPRGTIEELINQMKNSYE